MYLTYSTRSTLFREKIVANQFENIKKINKSVTVYVIAISIRSSAHETTGGRFVQKPKVVKTAVKLVVSTIMR